MRFLVYILLAIALMTIGSLDHPFYAVCQLFGILLLIGFVIGLCKNRGANTSDPGSH